MSASSSKLRVGKCITNMSVQFITISRCDHVVSCFASLSKLTLLSLSEKMRKLSRIIDSEIKVEEHKTLNHTRRIISSADLIDYTSL